MKIPPSELNFRCLFLKNLAMYFFCLVTKALYPYSAPGGLNLRSSIDLLSEKVKDFLLENRIQTFYQQELETVNNLVSLASQPVSRTDSQLVSAVTFGF